MNVNKNVSKNSKIIDGFKYYELNIKKDYYFINITNLPKENLIRFKLFLKKLDESNKEAIIIFENEFSLDYFLNQTQFFNDLGIKNINDLIKFFQTYFSGYNDKENDLINYSKENPNLLILKLLMFNNKIQINIELFQKAINNNNFINLNPSVKQKHEQLKLSNSCKNFNINIKKKLINDNTTSKNKIMNNNILLTEYHISLIKKRIPFFKTEKNFKLNLIYKSTIENPKKFHNKCDNKGPTLIIIFTKENRMFLTYNKISWHAIKESELNKASWRDINTKDDDIFIFDLFSKKILKNNEINNKNKNKTDNIFKFLQQYENYGPAYISGGLTFKIFDEDKYLSIEFATKNIDEESYIKSNYKLEKNNFLHIQDYEVYSININND